MAGTRKGTSCFYGPFVKELSVMTSSVTTAALLVHAESPRAILYKLGLARATVEPRGVACGSSRPLNVRILVIGDTRLRRRRSRLGAAYVNPLLAQTRGIIHISQPV